MMGLGVGFRKPTVDVKASKDSNSRGLRDQGREELTLPEPRESYSTGRGPTWQELQV